MAKRVWISALNKDERSVQAIMAVCRKYSLEADGHFWSDNLARMSWAEPIPALSKSDQALWIVLGKADDFGREETRFGLSMLTIASQAKRKGAFPVLAAVTEGTLTAESLPFMLQDAEVIDSASAGLGAKLVSRASQPLKALPPDYRLNVHGLPGIGLWFEIGPASLDWPGVMTGVQGAIIDAHGVGPAFGIPERTVLEYPVRGMKVQLGESEFDTWAVRNTLDKSLSYYVRCQGMPQRLLFGPYADGGEAEVHVLSLY